MFEKLEVFQMSQAMARHAALREGVVATNVANADTPGYRAKDVVSFADSYRTEHAQPMRATRPGHLGANGSYTVSVIEDPAPDSSSPDGNGVSIEDEMVKAVDVKRQHARALAIYKSSLNVLRASLGRG